MTDLKQNLKEERMLDDYKEVVREFMKCFRYDEDMGTWLVEDETNHYVMVSRDTHEQLVTVFELLDGIYYRAIKRSNET